MSTLRQERNNYSSIFLNTTFEVVEPESSLDAQMYLFSLSLFIIRCRVAATDRLQSLHVHAVRYGAGTPRLHRLQLPSEGQEGQEGSYVCPSLFISLWLYPSLIVSQSRPAPRIETGTESKEEIENEWLVGTAADKNLQSPAGYRKGRRK